MDKQLCYRMNVISVNEFWQSDSAFEYYMPYLAGQIAIVLFLTRLFHHVLKPLRQPKFVAEILAGFALSKDLLRSSPLFRNIFPESGALTEETIANIGLAFYVFLTGMEVNPNSLLKSRKKATCIAFAGVIIPMVIGAGIFRLHQAASKGTAETSSIDDNTYRAYVLWSLAISVTGFSVLARMLSDLKLLYTRLGEAALNAAMVADLYNWLMFMILIPFVMNGVPGIYSVVCTVIFVGFCFFVVRPQLVKFIDRKIEHEVIEPRYLMLVVVGFLLCICITDILGTHPTVGAFVFGLIIPRGRFADYIIDNIDYFASSIIAPVFFVVCGERLDFSEFKGQWPMSLGIILMLCTLKVFSTMAATFFFGMPARNSMGLGFLMNTKGVLSLIILNIASSRKILSSSSYTIMMSSILLMTIMVSPIINWTYRPRKRFAEFKLRTIQKSRIDVELRVLACVHNARQAIGMINICGALLSSKVSPLHVFALHLVELTGRSASVVLAHLDSKTQKNLMKSQEELENITKCFDAFEDEHEGTKVHTQTALSNYSTIHEDVHNLAEEKNTTLILLPFHKHVTADGSLETTHNAHRDIIINVLNDPPCSVGILVDRGLGSLSKVNMHILMVFIGGPDDQEALSVAWRMTGHAGVKLSVLRIVLFDEAAEVDTSNHDEAGSLLSAIMDNDHQKSWDDDYVSSFRIMAVNNDDSITYFEKEAHNSDDISRILTDLDKNHYDLYIVGQGKGRNLLALSKLLEWSDFPELGVVGDILSSNTFGSSSSVLVLQQFGSSEAFETTMQYTNNIDIVSSDGSENRVV